MSKPAPEGFGRLEELLAYFERGKAFTQELLKENERLRMRALQLEKEKMDLTSRLAPERLNELQEENRKLRTRLEALEAKFDEIEKENHDFAQRYVEIQSQNDNLLNLYVSSYQLHSTLDPREVVTVIEEIILNLIGAQEYFIAMMDAAKKHPTIVAGEGPEGSLRGKILKEVDPILAEVLRSGAGYFRPADGPASPHLACTPLKVKNDVVGAIAIGKLMDQKSEGLTAIDHELLGLLADHAATALVSSQLYSRTERKLRTVENFLELLKLDRKPVGPG
jgi:hypothetical protein